MHPQLKKSVFSLMGLSLLGMAQAQAPQLSAPQVVYTALGDSITYGLWSSNPCPATSPQDLSKNCENGTAFPDRLSQALSHSKKVMEQNLGISGAILNDVKAKEIPHIQPGANLITFYIGTNDIYRIQNGVDEQNQPIPDYTSDKQEQYFQSFELNYSHFVAQLKSEHPDATIVVLNLPATNELAKRLNQEVIDPLSSHGFIVVDLMDDPESYDPAMYASGPHPNDRGYQHIADKIGIALAPNL